MYAESERARLTFSLKLKRISVQVYIQSYFFFTPSCNLINWFLTSALASAKFPLFVFHFCVRKVWQVSMYKVS